MVEFYLETKHSGNQVFHKKCKPQFLNPLCLTTFCCFSCAAPSGKHTKSYGRSPFLWKHQLLHHFPVRKLLVYQRVNCGDSWFTAALHLMRPCFPWFHLQAEAAKLKHTEAGGQMKLKPSGGSISQYHHP